jgi:hypothetical protein
MGEPQRAQMATEETITAVILVAAFGFVVASSVNFHIEQPMGGDHQQIQGATGAYCTLRNADVHLKTEQKSGSFEGLTQPHMTL